MPCPAPPPPLAVLSTAVGINLLFSVFPAATASTLVAVTELNLTPPPPATVVPVDIGITFMLENGLRLTPCRPGVKNNCPPLPWTANTRLLADVVVDVTAVAVAVVITLLLLLVDSRRNVCAAPAPISSVLGELAMPLEVLGRLLLLLIVVMLLLLLLMLLLALLLVASRTS